MKIAILTKNMNKSYAQISTKFHHFATVYGTLTLKTGFFFFGKFWQAQACQKQAYVNNFEILIQHSVIIHCAKFHQFRKTFIFGPKVSKR